MSSRNKGAQNKIVALRGEIPTSHNNDLYSIDDSLLYFSRRYEAVNGVSSCHAAISPALVDQTQGLPSNFLKES